MLKKEVNGDVASDEVHDKLMINKSDEYEFVKDVLFNPNRRDMFEHHSKGGLSAHTFHSKDVNGVKTFFNSQQKKFVSIGVCDGSKTKWITNSKDGFMDKDSMCFVGICTDGFFDSGYFDRHGEEMMVYEDDEEEYHDF